MVETLQLHLTPNAKCHLNPKAYSPGGALDHGSFSEVCFPWRKYYLTTVWVWSWCVQNWYAKQNTYFESYSEFTYPKWPAWNAISPFLPNYHLTFSFLLTLFYPYPLTYHLLTYYDLLIYDAHCWLVFLH